jgi:hypothetical protein
MPIIRTSRLEEGNKVTETNGKLVLDKVVNIEPVLQANYEARKDSQNGWSKERNIRRVASIPFETWIAWTREEPGLIAGDKELRDKLLKKKLYAEENKVFWTINKGL